MGIGEDKMEAISGMEKAWQVSAGLLKAGFVIMLFWGAWQDLRRRKIGVFLLTASGIGAAGLRIIQLCISSRVLWNQVEYREPGGRSSSGSRRFISLKDYGRGNW